MLDRNRVGGESCYIRDLCIHIHIRYTRVITVQRLKSQSLTSSSVYISGDTEFCSWIRSISCEFAAISTASNNHKEDMVLLRYTCILYTCVTYIYIYCSEMQVGSGYVIDRRRRVGLSGIGRPNACHRRAFFSLRAPTNTDIYTSSQFLENAACRCLMFYYPG